MWDDKKLVFITVEIGDEDLEKLIGRWTNLGFDIRLITPNDDGTTVVCGHLNNMTLQAVVAHPLVKNCVDANEGQRDEEQI